MSKDDKWPDPIYYQNRAVKQGNWYDELCEAEIDRNLTMYLHLQSNLNVSKACKIFNNFLKPQFLHLRTEHITFGKMVQFLAPKVCVNKMVGPILSVTTSAYNAEYFQEITDQAPIVATFQKTPATRNLFYIVPCNPDKQIGDLLLFGDPFAICSTSTASGKQLYIEAEPPIAGYPTNTHNYSLLKLSPFLTDYCMWIVTREKVIDREHQTGQPMKQDENVVVKHLMTNRVLAIDPTAEVNTFFGLEHLAMADCYIDFKKEKPQNIWNMVSGEQHEQ